MEENFENADSTNGEEVVNPDNNEEMGLPADPVEVEPQDEVVEGEDVETLKQELQKARQQQQETYEQLKKAKGLVRDKEGKWVKKETYQKPQEAKDDITIMELKALLAANVHDDSDSEEVRLYARSHKLDIREALKLPEVKSMLQTRRDIRRTAEATNLATTRRGGYQTTGADLLAKAEKGEAPKIEDIEKFISARQQQKEANIKK